MHSDSARAEDTDWSQILALYDQLLAVEPTPVVALNRAVALAEVDGAAAALAVVDDLATPLAEYGPYHAVRADLLRRAGRRAEAVAEYDLAAAQAGNAGERAFLRSRRNALDSAGSAD